MSCARSNAAAWPTASVTSAKISGPLRRSRSRVTCSTPGTCPAAAATLLVQPLRHAVQQIVDRLLAELEADPNHDHRHAQGGHGVGLDQPGHARIARRPTRRKAPAAPPADDQMSVEKCRASASRAWLAYLSAARFKARDRE